MIYHSIRMSIKPGVSKESLDAAFALWDKMGRELPSIEFYCIGRDVGGEYDYGGMFALKDIDAYRAFVMAPITREVDLLGLPLVQNVVSMDLTDDPDPEIAQKIDEIHRVRFERDPDVLALVE